MRYNISIPITGYQKITVEANNIEEAIEKANNGDWIINDCEYDDLEWNLNTNYWEIEHE